MTGRSSSLERTGVLAFVLGSIGLVAVACADTSTEGEPASGTIYDAGGSDATLPSPEDASAPEASDARVEAGPITCTVHGFCGTKLPNEQTVTTFWGDGSGVLWAGTQEGDVLRWDGSAWKVQASELGALRAIWGSGATDVWIGGERGLYHGTGASSDSLAFTAVTLPGPTMEITSIWGPSASDVWAVGTLRDPNTWDLIGRAFHFTGGTWTLDPISENGVRYSDVFGSASGGVWLGGDRSATDPDGIFWSETVLFHQVDGTFVENPLPVDPNPEKRPYQKEASIIGPVLTSKTSLTIFGEPSSYFEQPLVWKGTSTDDGKTFTFTWSEDRRRAEPITRAMAAMSVDDVWAVGDYGRVNHWNGKKWSTVAISLTGYPVEDPFFAVWTGGPNEIWFGGKDMALRFDPSKEKNGGVE